MLYSVNDPIINKLKWAKFPEYKKIGLLNKLRLIDFKPNILRGWPLLAASKI